MPEPIHMIESLDSAAALFSGARIQILERLGEPDSASGIARRMQLPRQQVNYHLRELEKAGLVEFVEERRKGNCVERVMRATARSYVINPEVLGALGRSPEERSDRFSIAYLISMAARMIGDLASVRRRVLESGKRASTMAIETGITFASAGERAAFAEELTDVVARLAAKYHSTSGRGFRVVVGVYPAVKKGD